MWKFQNFSITHILREINFGESRSAKSAVLTHLEVLNFDSYKILHFLKAELGKLAKFIAPKIAKKGTYRTFRFTKIDFT